MIHRAIGYGASFPDLYEWTWGELSSFIMARMDHEKEQYRMKALMDMTHASTIARMFTGNSGKMTVMDTYTFLWTTEERQKAKVERLRATMEAEARKGKEVKQ